MGGSLQLKIKDIPRIREKLWNQQKRKCLLCKQVLLKKDAALDHCHTTGHCRATLHKNCNSIEGRVLHWVKRSGVPPEEFLSNLLEYWAQDYSHNPVHPRHKNEQQKHLTKLRKSLRKAKRDSTKQRIRDEIKHLQESLQ